MTLNLENMMNLLSTERGKAIIDLIVKVKADTVGIDCVQVDNHQTVVTTKDHTFFFRHWNESFVVAPPITVRALATTP
jgi:hypothetical protein